MIGKGFMVCEACDPFDVEIAIHGPVQLRRIVSKVQAAQEAGTLCSRTAGPVAQIPFSELSADDPLPDVLDYAFACRSCGARFSLTAETYHGQGGSWSRRREAEDT